MSRPLCKKCGENPAAVNYHKNDRVYYRKKCEQCNKKDTALKLRFIPHWQKAGYKKKMVCEKCGFKAHHQEQMRVFFIDGDMNNIHISNLKTVCLNCQTDLSLNPLGWVQGDLLPDF